jgi:tRNA-2-methylthio-N6-dimethylallyladenosine synthase
VQAGSDRILKAMNRGYSRAHYLNQVAKLKKRVPGLALGGDMIVGFPGESEEDFQQSLSILQAVRYDYLYSFKYSDRPFTKASTLPDKLPDQVKAERLGRLQALQRQISLDLHQKLVGEVEEVLVEGPAKKGAGLMTGRSRAGRAVNFPGPPELVGELVKVIITEGHVNSLQGRVCSPAKGEMP